MALLAAPSLAWDVLPIPNGDFSKPPGKAPAAWTLKGSARSLKVDALHGKAWILERSARLGVSVPLPAVPSAKGVEAQGWHAVVSLDVLSVVDGGRAQLELVRKSESGHKVLNRVSTSVNFAPGESAARRVWLSLPSEDLADLSELSLELRCKGGAGLVVDDLRVERFHRAPKRSLRGKENGKSGPDLLGAGMLGFTGLVIHQGTSFSILNVREGGPAARAGLVLGDVVVSVEGQPLPTSILEPGWDWFERSNEAVVGRALEAALAAGRDEVQLGVLRDGEVEELSLELPFKDVDLAGFPMRGPLAERLRADLLAWTTAHQKGNGGWPGTDAVNPALGGLALLGTRDQEYAPQVRRCFEFLLSKNPHPSAMKGLAYWTIAFQGMFFAEYYLASGDERARAWIVEATEWLPSTTHESKWGMQAFGHGPSGLPYDKKALMAPTSHLLVFDALARRCGVESRIYEHVKEYIVHSWSDPESGGHGGMGYNASFKDKAQFWSRSGLTALAATLRGENGAMRQGLCLFMQERHPWMLNSHAYGEPGAALGLLSLAVAHPPAFEELLPQWTWRFLCSWEPGYGLRYSTPHMGAPYMGEESIINLAYTLLMAAENRGLVMAGGEAERWLE
jgi:hypothetical protein